MASPYTSVTVNNYNANPPSDDGSETPENRINWATIKTKLADTLKVAVDAIDDNVLAAFAKMVGAGDVVSTAITYEVLAANQGDLIRATASSITITTPDATVVGSPFSFGLLNSSSGSITLDGNGSQTVNGSPSLTVASGDGYMVFTDGTNWFVIGRKTGVLPRGYIDGCRISNGTDTTNDLNIAAGVCRDSTNAVDITVAAMSGKQLDANWAPGATAGMRNSAAGIAEGTYHIFAVAKADGTQDIYAHTSATVATVITALQAESGGADYIYARRIGSIRRGATAIIQFTQVGDYFRFKTPIMDINTTVLDTTATNFTLTIPTGFTACVDLDCYVTHASNTQVLIRHPDDTDTAISGSTNPGTLGSPGQGNSMYGRVAAWANTSGEIEALAAASSTTLRANVLGYTDNRGKD